MADKLVQNLIMCFIELEVNRVSEEENWNSNAILPRLFRDKLPRTCLRGWGGASHRSPGSLPISTAQAPSDDIVLLTLVSQVHRSTMSVELCLRWSGCPGDCTSNGRLEMKNSTPTHKNLVTDDPVNVRGTELLASDTREHYRQKLARITLDSMVQFVGLLDANGTVLEINQVALDGVGIALSDVEGKPFWTTFWWQVSQEINEVLRESIRRAAQGEFVRWDAEIYGRASGKETIIIDASLCPVKDAQGNVVFITAEGRDITEKKAHEREIARQREELAELDQLKTQFFANISHEFRTPLTLMIGPLEDAIAEPQGLSAAKRDQIELAHRNSLRLLKLVNTLLDFSRIESGRIRASYEAVDLALMTAELASVFRSAIERAGMELLIDCAPLREPVYVDREMWEKIVFNLISNAFKFTFKGEIEVSLREAGNMAELSVHDTGTGIPGDEIPRLFDRFHRVKGASGRSYEGSGIGLALVQELVKLHGGNVHVASEVNHGSTFTVSIPLGTSHLPTDRIQTESPMGSTGIRSDVYVEELLRWLPDDDSQSFLAADMSGIQSLTDRPNTKAPLEGIGEPVLTTAATRILLVDDNADMRDYCRRLLVQSGYEVETAADGLAALTAARAREPDLILTDVMMPGLDGFGLLRELRADAKLCAVPVILLSARAGEEARIEGLHAGADDYLIKPFSARELLARAESHLKMARFRQDASEAIRLRTAQFETLLNQAPFGVYLVDADFRIREVNPAALPLFADIQGSVIGRDFDEIMHMLWERERADEIIGIFRQTLDGGESRNIPEWTANRREGGPAACYEWRVNRIVLQDGRFGVVCYFQDVSERKRAEQNANLLASIVESSDDAILSKSLEGVITSWNRGAERLFGYAAAEAVGQSITILIPPDRLEEEPKILERLRRGERVEHFETIRMRKDGSRVNVSLTISPIRAADRIVGASKVARDITEKVLKEEAVRGANAAMRRANIDLQQFAFAASHDLQEPLRMVTTYTQLLARGLAGSLDDDNTEYMRQVIGGSKRMSALLHDLLAYTELSRDHEGERSRVDLNNVFSSALSNLQGAIQESEALVEAQRLPEVLGNEMPLLQLFQNLIGNAIKYRSEAVPHVHISVQQLGPQWKFCVRDNGIGIAPEHQERVFGVFKRLHGHEIPGTGIGLAICHRVVERHGGRIWVESEGKGHGSTFCFTLQIAATGVAK